MFARNTLCTRPCSFQTHEVMATGLMNPSWRRNVRCRCNGFVEGSFLRPPSLSVSWMTTRSTDLLMPKSLGRLFGFYPRVPMKRKRSFSVTCSFDRRGRDSHLRACSKRVVRGPARHWARASLRQEGDAPARAMRRAEPESPGPGLEGDSIRRDARGGEDKHRRTASMVGDQPFASGRAHPYQRAFAERCTKIQ
jgi:hypothetical protein